MEHNKHKTVIVTIDTTLEESKLEDRLERKINEIIIKELNTTEFEYTLNLTYELKGN